MFTITEPHNQRNQNKDVVANAPAAAIGADSAQLISSEVPSFNLLELEAGSLFHKILLRRDSSINTNSEKRALFLIVDLMGQVAGWIQAMSSDEFDRYIWEEGVKNRDDQNEDQKD